MCAMIKYSFYVDPSYSAQLCLCSVVWCAIIRSSFTCMFTTSVSAYKDHRNGIKKPKRSRYPSMKGVSFHIVRNGLYM